MLFVFNKTKQQQSLNNTLYSLLYISPQIHINTPNSLWKKAQCRNPKQVSKKVATLEKTTVLYRSNSLISLWEVPTKPSQVFRCYIPFIVMRFVDCMEPSMCSVHYAGHACNRRTKSVT